MHTPVYQGAEVLELDGVAMDGMMNKYHKPSGYPDLCCTVAVLYGVAD